MFLSHVIDFSTSVHSLWCNVNVELLSIFYNFDKGWVVLFFMFNIFSLWHYVMQLGGSSWSKSRTPFLEGQLHNSKPINRNKYYAIMSHKNIRMIHCLLNIKQFEWHLITIIMTFMIAKWNIDVTLTIDLYIISTYEIMPFWKKLLTSWL